MLPNSPIQFWREGRAATPSASVSGPAKSVQANQIIFYPQTVVFLLELHTEYVARSSLHGMLTTKTQVVRL